MPPPEIIEVSPEPAPDIAAAHASAKPGPAPDFAWRRDPAKEPEPAKAKKAKSKAPPGGPSECAEFMERKAKLPGGQLHAKDHFLADRTEQGDQEIVTLTRGRYGTIKRA